MSEEQTKDFVCLDCSTQLETKLDKCPKCDGANIRKIDVRINAVAQIRSGVKAKVREEIGKKPIREYGSRQQLGKNGKEARVTIAIDREKDTYVQNVDQQDEKGNWIRVHHEDESLKLHGRKKSKMQTLKTDNNR